MPRSSLIPLHSDKPAGYACSLIVRPCEGMMIMTCQPFSPLSPPVLLKLSLLAAGLSILAACSPSGPAEPQACGTENKTLNLGFYAYFAPVSYSEAEDPASPLFNVHEGYEADLLEAMEAMDNPKLSFNRRAIAQWADIWLQAATPEYDIVGGGITILDSRTRDAKGNKAVAFTSGHIKFRQSLLVRPEDAERLAGYADLTEDVRVGGLAGTTGEHRLLELAGLVDEEGVLTGGTRVDTTQGVVVADGSSEYVITAAGESPSLVGRTHLYPPNRDMPQVVYLGDAAGEVELLEALGDGRIDALARGEVGNRDAARNHGGAFVVTALDEAVEVGGFAVAADDTYLTACLDERLDWLTDSQEIGYGEWTEDPSVFLRRARMWNERAR